MKLNGLNHLTLAVRDLERAWDFYALTLGCQPHARWDGGGYLSLDGLWLCLSLDPAAAPAPGYTHYAFGVDAADFPAWRERLAAAGVRQWRDNRSEGDSLYFLDPDGHQLELHVGSLASRLAACRARPYAGMRFFDEAPA
ncbi:fosfomycin resistance glutathione transferase [Chromobacterium sp. S0633]|uniref:fosfomycin resistance glutathione transferase n=1 Tax=Chromobacterium sp. S0633 TaxID=2957805 RepID=UPI00209CBCD1|nr:fosfomycin resistance glutathione transferase [Chromobacterium sp. S0633]MCP1292519.1 fosfomycin resistance glutathione transferase [Chromobacterium sp. S0633]